MFCCRKSSLEDDNRENEVVEDNLENMTNGMFDSNADVPIILCIGSENFVRETFYPENSNSFEENSRTENSGAVVEKISDENIASSPSELSNDQVS